MNNNGAERKRLLDYIIQDNFTDVSFCTPLLADYIKYQRLHAYDKSIVTNAESRFQGLRDYKLSMPDQGHDSTFILLPDKHLPMICIDNYHLLSNQDIKDNYKLINRCLLVFANYGYHLTSYVPDGSSGVIQDETDRDVYWYRFPCFIDGYIYYIEQVKRILNQ